MTNGTTVDTSSGTRSEPAWTNPRVPPPSSIDDGANVQKVGDVANLDDMTRAELASAMFFSVVTVPPNLINTTYAFTEPALQAAAAWTIPASIQF